MNISLVAAHVLDVLLNGQENDRNIRGPYIAQLGKDSLSTGQYSEYSSYFSLYVSNQQASSYDPMYSRNCFVKMLTPT